MNSSSLRPSLHPAMTSSPAVPPRRRRVRAGLALLGVVLSVSPAAALLIGRDRVRHLAVPVLRDPSSHAAATLSPLGVLPACERGVVANLPGRVGALLEASDGTLWAGGFDTGIYRRPPRSARGRELPVAGLSGRERFVNALVERGGHIWAATYGGLLELDVRGLRVRTHLRGLAVEALVQDGNRLLAGTISGLYRLSEGSGFEDLGLRGPEGEVIRITALAINGGTLWVGSPSGAYSLPLQALQSPAPLRARWYPLVFGESPAETNVVLSLAPLGEGVVAGTDNGGLVRLDPSGGVHAVRFGEPRANEANPGAAVTLGGAVLIGTQGAGLLSVRVEGKGLATARPQGWTDARVSALATGSTLWVGTDVGEVIAARCP